MSGRPSALVAKLIHHMHFIWHQIAAGATHRPDKHAVAPARWKVCLDLYRLACGLLHQAHLVVVATDVQLVARHKPAITWLCQNRHRATTSSASLCTRRSRLFCLAWMRKPRVTNMATTRKDRTIST